MEKEIQKIDVTAEPKSQKKREFVRSYEKEIQKFWEQNQVFQLDPNPQKEPWFGTFPYPYMNGRLHLGHAFTAGKVDFTAGYMRLKGKNALFPFAFHCTGMPIKACADKLKREIQDFGLPPIFPVEEKKPEEKAEKKEKEKKEKVKMEDKAKSKKAKTQQKAGAKYQWQIMQSSGVPEQEIQQFADAYYWLNYFPPLAQEDLKDLGAKIDWRRQFITTNVNPYYDAFIRWQFNKLKKEGKIKFGKRETIFSPLDNQPCMDHDRQSGEGVGMTEFTLVKQELLRPYPVGLAALEKYTQKVYLVPATLRAETMYGQTNCWIKPDGDYGAFLVENEIFICTARSARNIGYQFVDGFKEIKQLLSFKGEQLIGGAVHAPLSKYPVIYVFPMFTISTKKTTGVVTSVPSDSPDDYAAFRDLKLKPALRQKYGVKDEMIDGYDVVPIIDIPDYGKLAAVKVVEDMKIRSQNDIDLLKEAKDKVYKEGFYEGTMLVGPYKGKKVSEVKPLLKKLLIESGAAIRYWEPKKEVISRSGDVCVVALVDQWYLDYGEPTWQKQALECLAQMETFGDDVRNQFIKGLNWIHEWACSRSYGLGSKIPWDPTYLIESLSDSTIYMAFYTIAHLLQGGVVDGSKPGPLNIQPGQLTDEVFEYIFGNTDVYPDTEIPKSALDKCKNEFNYWYPVSLRVSGKDLINNHLIFWIYNHVALFPKDKWPRGVKANGHVLLNGDKISKSTGNFITLGDGIKRFSADGMRIALAESGDSIEDSNFTTLNADNGLLRLHTFVEWCSEMVDEKNKMRRGPSSTFAERVLEAHINLCIQETDSAYDKLLFQKAMKVGFFDMMQARDQYRQVVLSNPNDQLNWDLIYKFIKTMAIICAPVTSHTSEHIWRNILKEEGSIFNAKFPTPEAVDNSIIAADEYLNKSVATFRSKIGIHTRPPKKKGQPQNPYPKEARIYVALSFPEWHQQVLTMLNRLYSEKGAFPDMSLVASSIDSDPILAKQKKKVMGLVATLKEEVEKEGISALSLSVPFSEVDVLTENLPYLETTLKLQKIWVKKVTDEGLKESTEVLAQACPGKPLIFFD